MGGRGFLFAGLMGVAALLDSFRLVLAAEAYVCGPSDVVYVEAADLERMKRTHPCIAAFYGLKVEPAVQPAPPPETKLARSKSNDPRQAVKATRAVPPSPKKLLDLKSSTAAEIAVESRRASADPARITLPAHQAQGTDYRNVRVLNAQTPETEWFHHIY